MKTKSEVPPLLHSATETARRLGMSDSTIRDLARKGELPGRRRGGARVAAPFRGSRGAAIHP